MSLTTSALSTVLTSTASPSVAPSTQVSQMPQQRQIITQKDWEKFYSEANYEKQPRLIHVKQFALHYFIVLEKNERKIVSYIESEKCGQKVLTAQDPKNHSLTPLIVATMRGSTKIAEGILKKMNTLGCRTNEEIEKKDEYGWTALHHSAISSKEIFDLLVKYGANQKALTNNKGTPENIRNLTDRNIQPITFADLKFQKADGSMVSVSSVGLKAIGLKEYRDIPLYEGGHLKALWQQQMDVKTPEFFTSSFNKRYSNYLNLPPKLIVSEKSEIPDHLELMSGQEIKFGEVIAEYGGEFRGLNRVGDHSFLKDMATRIITEKYELAGIDSVDIGNVSRYSNWGWPNAIALPHIVDGCERSLLVCINSNGIKNGELIHWDYGPCYNMLSYGFPMKLLGRNHMHHFFSHGLNYALNLVNINDRLYGERARKLSSESAKMEYYLRANQIESFLSFPLNVPGALLDLHYSKLVSVNDWKLQMNTIKSTSPLIINWQKQHQGEAQFVRSVLERVIEFDKGVDKKDFKDKAAAWILRSIGKYSLNHILKGMDKILEKNQAGTISALNWESSIGEINQFLDQYDYAKDEGAPLGNRRVAEDFANILLEVCGSRFDALIALSMNFAKIRQEGLGPQHETYQRLEISERILKGRG